MSLEVALQLRWSMAMLRLVQGVLHATQQQHDTHPAKQRTRAKQPRPCADLNRDCWIQGPECWPLHHKATEKLAPVSFPKRRRASRPRRQFAAILQQGAHAGNRAQGTSMEGLYVTTTLRVPCKRQRAQHLTEHASRRTRLCVAMRRRCENTPGQDRTGDLQRVGLTS